MTVARRIAGKLIKDIQSMSTKFDSSSSPFRWIKVKGEVNIIP
jgi:hypothetical protein